ncbi:MAG: ATP synthase F1 subunit epsilon [Ignavibacteria bacterium RIFOXYB2_FULL_35_12]|nr:MAG: ATP synthase F1 subunit epsilon [Ignavibacteria bacterium GWA2_36_19]OGU52333.1 MAG: ATP synthase F1 subunit epsilon [Ignavibacteria bacterium GWC2_35_8]OGU57064.1 MAG: ATP synthase F1 subunit epsilon [Ignavibacteria bacterium GWF2_35_20]OGU82705.1 MAG: ATP synthase F1 subunit epsilon [Ignavibacteria bacterium RIFOXYA2_FULL_35_9]OGU83890.1 MAG: ATP synthase F1 subunit epsilon [Ignavibacteria bacterium RIFOXYA12_FULL_35_25]OGU90679.1 MAG: ATP synthase F1 subunit epsilon [Ignavibacteria 
MHELDLDIISPEKKVYSGKVKSVTIPGTKGNFQVLFNHAPLISTFELGIIKVGLPGDSTRIFTTSGGSAEILDNKVLLLSDTIEAVENIDLERALKSKVRAEERLTNKSGSIDFDRARASLAKAMNRIKAVEKYSTLKKDIPI